MKIDPRSYGYPVRKAGEWSVVEYGNGDRRYIRRDGRAMITDFATSGVHYFPDPEREGERMPSLAAAKHKDFAIRRERA